MQPAELVAIMAAIIYSGRPHSEDERPETRQAAVEEAWALWHLAMAEWSDPGVSRLDQTGLGS
jgi:hypothetical protein